MSNNSNVKCIVATLSLAAATLLPAAALGQNTGNERSSGVPNYHLTQVSVGANTISLDEFQARTEAIRSCRDAKELAQELDADFKRNRFVMRWELPKELSDTLKDTNTGRATPVFANDPSIMRVLVICNRF